MAVNNIQFTRIELEITKYLFKHYKGRYNARQLARILSINHAHANKLCKGLSAKQLLVKEDIGNAVYFTYNYESKPAIKFIEYVLSLEDKEFPKWLIVLLHNLNKFKPIIKMGLVFGSAIINKNYNDLDVLLVYDIKETKKIKKIKDEIRRSQLVEKPVRYMDMSEKDIFINKEDKVFYDIISNNLIFYNAEKYVEVIKKCRR